MAEQKQTVTSGAKAASDRLTPVREMSPEQIADWTRALADADERLGGGDVPAYQCEDEFSECAFELGREPSEAEFDAWLADRQAAEAKNEPSSSVWANAAEGEVRIINGRPHKHVTAYKTASGKSIAAHWRPIRCCRSYAQQPTAKPRVTVVLDEVGSPPVVVTLPPKLALPAPSNGATPDKSLIPNVPEYYAQNGEVNFVQKAIGVELNVLLTGPTGCGKTHLAERICMNAQREMFTIQGGAGATYERIIAQKDLAPHGSGATVTTLTKGILPMAMERGAVLYLDEPNAIPSEVLFYLFSAMDDRRAITLETGEVVKAKAGFVVIGAMNEGAGYAGTALLNTAFRQRGVIKDLGYLPPKREATVLVTRTGITKELAKKLTEMAERLRSGVIKTPISTRALLFAAKLHVAGISIHEAIEGAITNQIPAQFASERKAVSDVVVSYFGMEVK